MGFPEDMGEYWRGKYKNAEGKYVSVRNEHGEVIRFAGRRAAKQAADAEEAKIRAKLIAPKRAGGRQLFREYAEAWYTPLTLQVSTMANYKNILENHLVPTFGDQPIEDISERDVNAWEHRLIQAGYALTTRQGHRGLLSLMMADAIRDGHIEKNPAVRPHRRGARHGRVGRQAPEKAVVDTLQTILIAERVALTTGRDDEFVLVSMIGCTGMRWGETVGLEQSAILADKVRVDWQLYEVSPLLHRIPPKDDSYRVIDLPTYMAEMLQQHLARTASTPCPCHGSQYVFSSGDTYADARLTREAVAAEAGIGVSTVSRAIHHPERVALASLTRVQAAIDTLTKGLEGTPRFRPHWTRGRFGDFFAAAATGEWPRHGVNHPPHPVYVTAEPWPGRPIRGRYAADQAAACWVPIERDLTPHGLRHSHRTLMEEIGVRKVLMDARMGHFDSSVSGRYAHVSPRMREKLLAGLEELWQEALQLRAELHPRSEVAVLDALLQKIK